MDMDALKKMPLFKDIPGDVLEVLVPLVGEERFEAGSEIFAEGSVSDRFFVVTDGEVEIKKKTDKKEESYKLIAVLQAGEFFGEMAVLLKKPRTATAVAKTDVTLAVLGRGELLEMFTENPESAFKLMGSFTSVIMGRLKHTTEELVTVYETGRLITAARSMDELSECVLDSALNALELADAGLFVIWNEFNEDYEIYAKRGLEVEPGTPFDESDPVMKLLFEKNEPFVSFDLESDPRFSLGEDTIYRARSLVGAPFILQDRLVGFMLLLSRTIPNAFSYSQMVLLSAICGYVSVSVENMQYMQAEIDRSRLSQSKSTIQPF
jgi:CRP-like cAMP-binding protein